MSLKWFYYDPMTLPEAKDLIATYTARGIKTEKLQSGETGLFTVRALLPTDKSSGFSKSSYTQNRVFNQ